MFLIENDDVSSKSHVFAQQQWFSFKSRVMFLFMVTFSVFVVMFCMLVQGEGLLSMDRARFADHFQAEI